MASFNKAREINAPGLELDIHVCASGELVVAHDDSFQRTAGDSRRVAELGFNEIKTIDVGSFFNPAFRGERPPLLEDVLETFCPDMYIDIELKTRKTKNDPLPGLLAKTIKRFGDRALKSVTISSFNPFSILVFKQLCPQVPTAVIWSADREVPLILRRGFGRFLSHCDYLKPVHCQVTALSRLWLGGVKRRPLIPWTIDDFALAKKMLKAGCTGIITNRPQDMGGFY
jgi:glycerophosphoryl diester phosphodiesterase